MASPVDKIQPLMAQKCDGEHDLHVFEVITDNRSRVTPLRRALAAFLTILCLAGMAGVAVLGVQIAQSERKFESLFDKFPNLSEKFTDQSAEYKDFSRVHQAQGRVLAARGIFHEDPAHSIAIVSDNIVSDMATVGTTIMITVTQTDADLATTTSAESISYGGTTTVVTTVPTVTVTSIPTTATVTETVVVSSLSLASYTNPFEISAVAPISASGSSIGNCIASTVTVYYPSSPWSIGQETSTLVTSSEITTSDVLTPTPTTSNSTPTTETPAPTSVQDISGVLPISGSLTSMSDDCTKTDTTTATTTTASADGGLVTSSVLLLTGNGPSTVSGTTTWTSYSTIIVTVSKSTPGPQEMPLPAPLTSSGGLTSLILQSSTVGTPLFRNTTTTMTMMGTGRSFYASPHPVQSTFVTSGGVKQASVGLGGNGKGGSGTIHYCVVMLVGIIMMVV